MDENDDEDVVFTNTALYEHLVSSGFSDFESASCLQPAASQSAELAAQSRHQVAGMADRLTSALDRLGLRSGPLLVPTALSCLLDSGLMGDRDRAVAADLCSHRRQDPAETPAADWFLVAALVAGLAVAVWLPVWWLLLLAALLSAAGGAAVARVRAAAGRRRVAAFCRSAAGLRRAGLRCCRLLQEAHLMARGVTLSSGDAGAEAAFTAQYGGLVQAAGASLLAACAAYCRATLRLRRQQPLLEGVDPDRHYIACDQAALAGFDENNFTVKDVKSLQQLLTDSQSEFVRRCCLGLNGDLLPPETCSAPRVPLALLSDLAGTLSELQRRLSAGYRTHTALWTSEPEPEPVAAPPAGGLQRLYVGVHSVCLQAQVVALRARALEEALAAAGDGEGAEQELHDRLRWELTEIQQRLESGQLFCEQTLLQLSRLEGGGGPEQTSAPSPPPAAASAPVLLSALPEPELQDQFFEAVVEGAGRGGESGEELPDREERVRRRLERDKARELLKELNVALTGKRQEWRVREAVAKGEPVPPPPPEQGTETDAGSPGEEADPYKVNRADLYDFSGSEEEGDGYRPPVPRSRRVPPADVTDGYRVDEQALYQFSDSEGEGDLVLPPAGDLTHLLPVQRRARPPSRRPPSRPGSVAGTLRGETGTSHGQDRETAGSNGLSPTLAGSNVSHTEVGSRTSLAACRENTAGLTAPPAPSSVHTASTPPSTAPPSLPALPLGPARYRAAALGLPSRQGFPAEMAAQAAALALRRRQGNSEETFGDGEETFGDGEDGAEA